MNMYIYGIAAILWQSLAKPLTLSASTVCKGRAKVPHITSGHFSRATPESTRGTSDHFSLSVLHTLTNLQ